MDNIVIKFESSNVQGDISALDRLIDTLERLQTIGSRSPRLTSTINQINKLNSAINNATGYGKINTLASALGRLNSSTQGLKLVSVVNQLSRMPGILNGLNDVSMSKVSTQLDKLMSSFAGLKTVEKATGLTSVINNLKNIPKVASSLKTLDFDDFAKSIKKVTDVLKPLATEMDKISRGFSRLPSKLQSVIKNNDKLASSNKKAGSSFHLFGISLSNFVTKAKKAYLGTTGIMIGLGKFVEKANDFVENVNLFNVSMGRFAEEAGAYAQKVQDLAGIDMSEFMRNQGILMSVAKGFGVTEESAYKMSKALTETAYDAMSLFNATNPDEAFNKFKSGLAGELEPLRQWGYALDQATLQQVALRNGITKTFSAMTQGEKAQIRFMAIMEQSARMGVFNDLARQIHTPANALRILKSQFGVLARTIGQVFIPAVMAIVPYIQAVVKVLIQFFGFLANLVGYKAPEIKGIDTPVIQSIGDTGEAMDKLGGATGKANKQLREQEKILAGFDRLNVLDEPKSPIDSDGGGGGGIGNIGGGLSTDFNLPDRPNFLEGLGEDNAIVTSIKSMVKNIIDAFQPAIDIFKSIDFDPLKKGLKKVWDSTKPILDNLAKAFRFLINDILAPFSKWFSEKLSPVALETVASVLDVLNEVLESVGRLAKNFYNDFMLPFASWQGEKSINSFKTLNSNLRELSKWLDENPDIADKLTGVAIGGVGALKVSKMAGFNLGAKLNPFNHMKSGQSIPTNTSSADGVPDIAKKAEESLAKTPPKRFDISKIWQNPDEQSFGTFFSALNTNMFGGFSSTLSTLGTRLSTDFTTMLSNLSVVLSPLIAPISEVFSPLLTGLSSGFTTVTTAVSSLATTLSGVLMPVIEPLIAPFTGLINTLTTFINPIYLIIGGLALVGIALTDIWNESEEFRTNVGKAIEGVMDTFDKLWKNFIEPIGNHIMEMFDSIWKDTLQPLWKNFKKMIEEISNKFLELWNESLKPVVDWFIVTFGPILSEIIGVVAKAFSLGLSLIGTYFGTAFNIIGKIVSAVIGVLKGVIDFIVGVFTGNWDKAWSGVVQIFESLLGGIGGFFGAIWDGIVSLFTKGGKIFLGIVDGIGKIFKGIVNVLIDGIERVINVPFGVIRTAINAVRDFSFLGAKPFGWLPYLHPISLPRLNVGTNYVKQSGLAVIHEGEAVVPKKYNPALGNGGNNSEEMIAVLLEQNHILNQILEKEYGVYLDGNKVNDELERSKVRQQKQYGY